LTDFVEKPVAAVLLNADIVAGNAARQWLAGDSGKPRISCCVKISISESVTMCVCKEGKRAFAPS